MTVQMREVTKGHVTVIYLDGEIDTDNAKLFSEFLSGLLDTGKHNVLLDFELLKFISSSGFGELVSFQNRLTENNGKMGLCSMSREIRDAFDVIGLSRFFDMHQNVDDALPHM